MLAQTALFILLLFSLIEEKSLEGKIIAILNPFQDILKCFLFFTFMTFYEPDESEPSRAQSFSCLINLANPNHISSSITRIDLQNACYS